MSQEPRWWDDRLPDRNQLRAETRCLAACVRDQLLRLIPEDEIRGIYLTGSTVKSWDSPLDYVPEISHVDIHLAFHADNAWRQYLDTVPGALAIQKEIEACFAKRIPQPLHHPRLQLLVMNKLLAERPGFVYAPQSTVVVLHGEPYPQDDYSNPDTIRRHNAADLVERAEFAQSACPSSPSTGSAHMRATCWVNWSGAYRPSARSSYTSQDSAPNPPGASTGPV